MAPVNTLADYPGGGQVVMDFLEFVMNGGLAFQVLSVQALDELMSWLLALEVRVVAVTQVELAAGGWVVADPPAARFVTVVLSEQRVDGGANRAENAELFKVRAEPGPEPAVGPGLVDGARVHLEPMTELRRVENPEGDRCRSGTGQGDHDDQAPLHHRSPRRINEVEDESNMTCFLAALFPTGHCAVYLRVHLKIW
jgi:hypothetical protein